MASSRVYLNNVSEKLVRQSGIEGMAQVSIPDDRSATGYGYLTVSSKQVFDATRKAREGEEADDKGRVRIPGQKAVALPEGDVKGYQIKNGEGAYEKVAATGKEIVDMWEASRQAYREKLAGAKAAEAGGRRLPEGAKDLMAAGAAVKDAGGPSIAD